MFMLFLNDDGLVAVCNSYYITMDKMEGFMWNQHQWVHKIGFSWISVVYPISVVFRVSIHTKFMLHSQFHMPFLVSKTILNLLVTPFTCISIKHVPIGHLLIAIFFKKYGNCLFYQFT